MKNEPAGGLLASPQWLMSSLNDPNVVLIDTRGPDDFWQGHLDHARHFDPFPFHWNNTTERSLNEFRGQLEWIFSILGLSGSETVVFYENDAGMRAARGVWLLEYAGHPRARMLDGGLKALGPAVKLTVEAEAIKPAPFKLKPRPEILASRDDVLNGLSDPRVQILDVRGDQEYYGEKIRARRAGAIPGAIHLDWVGNLDSAGMFKSSAALRESFARNGLDPNREIITYCQGGYRAAHTYVALRLAGYRQVRNYIASWAEWGNDEELPIERPRRR